MRARRGQRTGLAFQPVWERLAAMNPAEQANAEISVELPESAPAEAQELARGIEQTWNEGRFEQALELFEELGRLVNPRDVAVGCSWREPIPTVGVDWGSDVRVGNRDTIFTARPVTCSRWCCLRMGQAGPGAR